jgi:hypothetical protein
LHQATPFPQLGVGVNRAAGCGSKAKTGDGENRIQTERFPSPVSQ